MKKSLLLLAFGVSFLVTNAQVVINELMYNPPESGTDSIEFLELYNSGSASVDLSGYSFTHGIDSLLPNVSIPAGGYFVFAANSAAVEAAYGITNVYQWESGALSNGGEALVLVDAQGNLVDEVLYDDKNGWPVEADGDGYSIELCSATEDNNDSTYWYISTNMVNGLIVDGVQVYATPGAANTANCSSSTSINELNTKKVTLYPNPVGDGIVNFNAMTSGIVVNLLGAKVLEFNKVSQLEINLNSGVYFVKITETNQTIKFVVK